MNKSFERIHLYDHDNTRCGQTHRACVNWEYVLLLLSFLYELLPERRKMIRFSISNDHDTEYDPTTSVMRMNRLWVWFFADTAACNSI